MAEPTATEPQVTEPTMQTNAEPTIKTFDEILGGGYQAEFDRRVQQAITKREKTLNSEFQNTLSARDADLEALKKQLEGFDGSKQAFEDLQTKYNTDAQTWKDNLAKQAYEFEVKMLANELEFTSKSAKDYFVSQAINKNLPLNESGKIMGFEDFVKDYKESDPSAIKALEEPATNTTPSPTIVTQTTNTTPTNENPFAFNFLGVRPK